jgi:hypothetical protein
MGSRRGIWLTHNCSAGACTTRLSLVAQSPGDLMVPVGFQFLSRCRRRYLHLFCPCVGKIIYRTQPPRERYIRCECVLQHPARSLGTAFQKYHNARTSRQKRQTGAAAAAARPTYLVYVHQGRLAQGPIGHQHHRYESSRRHALTQASTCTHARS